MYYFAGTSQIELYAIVNNNKWQMHVSLSTIAKKIKYLSWKDSIMNEVIHTREERVFHTIPSDYISMILI